MMRSVSIMIFVFVCTAFVSSSVHAQHNFNKLVWFDEFNSNDKLPDSSKWSYDNGNGCPEICGWGNNELQYYTANRAENARVENGLLIIEARKESFKDAKYTSARMVTKNKGDWKYGKIEIKAKLPNGLGMWPAIWMLPTKWEYGAWPRSGEIDIMENVGYLPDSLFGTVHTDAFNGMKGTQKSKSIFVNDLATNFHVYGVVWDEERIDFLLDGKLYHSFFNNHSGIAAWPFNKEFYLILNIAIGGNWGGKMGINESIFPQQMQIDYVRVYQ